MTNRATRLGLEPESTDKRIEFGDPLDREVAHSIAISLKRIADALDGTTLGVDISESLAALTYQKVYKS